MIETRRERKRGCGFRKPGGLYLVTDGPGLPCVLLPIPLTSCPTCGAGIKPARGWTWVQPDALLGAYYAEHNDRFCPLRGPGQLGETCGLLWIGESFYPTPEDFMREAAVQGISRRIQAVPKGFELGQWVMLGHRRAVTWPAHAGEPPVEKSPGIFQLFRPARIEYVVRGDETPEELEAKEKRHITLVKVEPIEDEPREPEPLVPAVLVDDEGQSPEPPEDTHWAHEMLDDTEPEE